MVTYKKPEMSSSTVLRIDVGQFQFLLEHICIEIGYILPLLMRRIS